MGVVKIINHHSSDDSKSSDEDKPFKFHVHFIGGKIDYIRIYLFFILIKKE